MHTIHVDGGSNNATIGEICYIVINPKGYKTTTVHTIYDGKHTNNQMEYKALKRALVWILGHLGQSTKVRVKTDSMLVFNQVNKNWKVRDVHIKRYISTIDTLIGEINQRFERFHIIWVPRRENQAGIELEKIQKERKRIKAKRSKV